VRHRRRRQFDEQTLDYVERGLRLVVLVASAMAMLLTALHAAGPT
jgi:hypothetical protein